MKKGIIFDMDGTLWDSAANVAKAWDEVARAWNYPGEPIDEAAIMSIMGKTMTDIADCLFAKWDEKRRMELLDACCEAENAYLREVGGKLYPEFTATMEKLKRDYHLYIVSNCQTGYIEAFLDHYGFWKYFEDIECFGNNFKPKSDNIRLLADRNHLDRAVYVGDIQGDCDATEAAGLPFIHAAYGFGSIDHEVPVIRCLAELPETAAGVLEG